MSSMSSRTIQHRNQLIIKIIHISYMDTRLRLTQCQTPWHWRSRDL